MAKNSNGLGSITYTMRNGKKYWTGRVTLGTDINGKQVRKSFSSFKKSVVVEKMRKATSYTNISGPIDSGKNILGPSIHHWAFNIKSKEIKSSSLSRYGQNIRLRILPYPYANIAVKDITIQNLQEFIDFLTLEEKWPEGSVDFTLQIIRTFLDYCLVLGRIQANPAKYVKVPRDKNKFPTKKSYRIFSKHEQDLILEALDLSDTVEQMLYIDFFSGLRRSELRALDLDSFKSPDLIIDKQMGRTYRFMEDGNYQLKKDDLQSLKTQSSKRVLPLPKLALPVMERAIQDSRDKHKRQGLKFDGSSTIFVDDLCRPIEEKRANRRLGAICKKVGIEPRPLHSIRHSYATRLFEAGIDVKTVQKLMGHSDYKTTMDIYIHVMPEKKMDAVSIFDEIYK